MNELSVLLPEYIIQHAINEPEDSNSEELWKRFKSAAFTSPITCKLNN